MLINNINFKYGSNEIYNNFNIRISTGENKLYYWRIWMWQNNFIKLYFRKALL